MSDNMVTIPKQMIDWLYNQLEAHEYRTNADKDMMRSIRNHLEAEEIRKSNAAALVNESIMMGRMP